MKDSVLVTLADSSFLDQAKQLFGSAHHKGEWKGDFALIACDVPHEKLLWFREKGIFIHACPWPVLKKQDGGVFRLPAQFGKFHLFTNFFRQWKQIVFLDADIIVRASLEELSAGEGISASYDMENAPLERQFFSPTFDAFKWDAVTENMLKDLKKNFDLSTPSFNSGVLSFPSSLVLPDTFARISELFECYYLIERYCDQPILNLFFYKNWDPLPEKFNRFISATRSDSENIEHAKDASIVHFAGLAKKPWDKTSPFYDEWKENLAEAESLEI
ncbi:MAG: glycosyltransferase [Candidatus Pacebacteria bacterium]|nr:glycosyltransferase [Candidatus Paceibacterota bacterium]MDD5356993.1 glycosyltransferase [Candidatus Paceibacterota bacterium]